MITEHKHTRTQTPTHLCRQQHGHEIQSFLGTKIEPWSSR